MSVPVEEARRLFGALLPLPPTVRLPLHAARGAVLASGLAALVSHPSATESALDGLACREADAQAASREAPVWLRVVGESRAGAPYAGEVGPGECVRIYTGAPLPPGADAICPVEELLEGEAGGHPGHLGLRRPASPKDVRHEGSDFRAGEEVLPAGLSLTPARLSLAAALGHGEVSVRRWRVALLSTGDELRDPGEALRPGEVYDSNRVGLRALLEEIGCEVLDLGRAPDSPEELARRLGEAGRPDLLLTSGGVSMGRYDFVRDLLIGPGGEGPHPKGSGPEGPERPERPEREVAFWKVKMRPGGPALCGRWRGLPVFGLPGNPVSSLVVFQVLVRPVLTGQPLTPLRLPALTPFRGLPDKVAFWRAHVEGAGVRDYRTQSSGVLRSLSEAGGLVVVPPGADLQPGDLAEVLLLP